MYPAQRFNFHIGTTPDPDAGTAPGGDGTPGGVSSGSAVSGGFVSGGPAGPPAASPGGRVAGTRPDGWEEGAAKLVFLQIFGGLVLGCIKTKFCKKICV